MLYKKTSEVNEFFRLLWKEHQQFSWDLYALAFKTHESYDAERALQIDIYVSCFLAYHRLKSIEKIRLDNPKLNISWLEKIHSDRLRLDNDLSRRCFIYSESRYQPKALYDNVLVIDGTPTIIKFKYRNFPREKKENNELIRNLVMTDIAYGIIVTEDIINDIKNSNRAKALQERGGIVLTLPMDKRDLIKEVRKICGYHEFRILE
ncbi:hypothetical protein HYV49_00420 [Candidatus Pacearchaeota archaeon]|nr:hypothetical protein [Candidatus Pacearchaeota archaeon]